MTSKRNPNKRNLGPVIALTGAGIAIVAVIAGFIAVGGPGDARERRLDGMTMARISQVLGIAQCAYNATGTVPATLQDAAKTRAKFPDPQSLPPLCGETQLSTDHIATGDQPANLGDVSYRPTTGAGVSVCGNFRRATDPRNGQDRYPIDTTYIPLEEARPAGVHCYEIQLVPPG